jgi:hypothetical protein
MHKSWLHFTVHYYTPSHTHTHTTPVSSHIFISRCLVKTSNSRRSLSSGFPNCPWPQLRDSHSNGSQQRSPSGSQIHQLADSLHVNSKKTLYAAPKNTLSKHLTHPVTLLAYNFSARTPKKIPLLCSCSIVA